MTLTKEKPKITMTKIIGFLITFVIVFMIMAVIISSCGGCSAGYWGGRTSGERPGIMFQKNVFGAKFEMSSNGEAKVDNVSYTDSDNRSIFVSGLKYNQTPSEVVKAEPAKIDAIARLQLTQVEYARVTWEGVTNVVREIVPVLKLLAMANFTQTESGMALTLPNGIKIGANTLTKPVDFKNYLDSVAKTLETSTQPAVK